MSSPANYFYQLIWAPHGEKLLISKERYEIAKKKMPYPKSFKIFFLLLKPCCGTFNNT